MKEAKKATEKDTKAAMDAVAEVVEPKEKAPAKRKAPVAGRIRVKGELYTVNPDELIRAFVQIKFSRTVPAQTHVVLARVLNTTPEVARELMS
ncbi:MAG: hypothetical protein GY820_38700 [Gammaproteobacteria bacterium]|nr:hypothetical protein [Gammaproteobacteria bacterium]